MLICISHLHPLLRLIISSSLLKVKAWSWCHFFVLKCKEIQRVHLPVSCYKENGYNSSKCKMFDKVEKRYVHTYTVKLPSVVELLRQILQDFLMKNRTCHD